MTEERIQQFLLGKLGDAELEQFELLLLEDPNLHFIVEEKETDRWFGGRPHWRSRG